jgi:hypothetical protein
MIGEAAVPALREPPERNDITGVQQRWDKAEATTSSSFSGKTS